MCMFVHECVCVCMSVSVCMYDCARERGEKITLILVHA